MNKKNAGFTLLEVMVAMFVIAVAMVGAIKAIENSAQNASRLSNRTFANWVAINKITELRLNKEWPKFGKVKGESEMSDRKWKWEQKTIKTEDKKVRRVELSVWAEAKDGQDPFVTVVGFLTQP
ncbi:MAG: type II secretion system protein GspI [Thiotrichales bacterium]|nr:MAG: type II secretion system protein GspI [Thiotrichales bacterium]